MGQCQYCAGTTMTTTNIQSEKTCDPAASPKTQTGLTKADSDPGQDSGHSSEDEASCGGGDISVGCGGGDVGVTAEYPGRGSHSSESSGKFSMRDSVGSIGDDRTHSFSARIEEYPIDSPVFEEQDPTEDDDNGVFTEDSLHPLQDLTRTRKVSRGSSRGSRGSSSSERGSVSSVSSVTAFLKARLGRSVSLTVPEPDVDALSTCSSVPADNQRPHRAVSLRLPRSHRRSNDSDTNLPTIYVDDSPGQEVPRKNRRKSSLQQALSLLSLNTLMKHEAAVHKAPQKQQKPVQKILRQPRRRHNTVRGLSGMAIDGANQGAMMMTCPSLQRCHTLYYPTNTTIRHTARRTHSLAT